jgi:hypothetical protein
MKTCNLCKTQKSFSEFHVAKQGKNGPIYKGRCKECYRKKEKEKYHSMTIESRIKRRESNRCNTPEYRRQYKLKTYYGLTTTEFSAMVLQQNNQCKICEEQLDNPQIDHCHTTGKIRGILCRPCNMSLGLLKENTNTLRNMIFYINDNI